VNVLENGKVKQIIAPDGQKFQLSGVDGGLKGDNKLALPTLDVVYGRAWDIVGIIFAAFLYVFGIAAVYAIFMRQYELTGKASFQAIAYGATAVSIFLPYSGYIIILAYFGFNAFIAEYVAK